MPAATSRRPLTMAALAVALVFAACGETAQERQNVRPPIPGTPQQRADVQGIYRTVHQGLLQLRGNGAFVLIEPERSGPSAGHYTLEDGMLVVQSDSCGDVMGQYRLEVGGKPEPGKATLNFAAVDDSCESRRQALTLAPWVYADS